MPEMRPDGATARVGATESFVTVAPAPVQRDARGRFTAGTARPPRRRPGAQPRNLNSVKNPWVVFWRRRALRPEDRWILPLLEDYAASLMAQRGGPEMVTAALRFTIELAGLARGCVMLILAQAAGAGGIVSSLRSASVKGGNVTRRISDQDIPAALARFMALEANALRTIGMESSAKPVLSPEAYWTQVQASRAAQGGTTTPASPDAADAAQPGSGSSEEET